MDQLGDLLALVAEFASEHRNGEIAQPLGLRLDGEARHPAEQARGVEHAVEQPGRVPEEGQLLLQEDIDAAEEDAPLADVRLIGADRRVGGHEQGVVAEAAEGGGEGVVVQAGAAEHARRPGGDRRDPHGANLED